MLIVTRRIGDSIIISDNIEVIVLGVNGNQIKIGVNAPKEIPVDRKELYLKKKSDGHFEQRY